MRRRLMSSVWLRACGVSNAQVPCASGTSGVKLVGHLRESLRLPRQPTSSREMLEEKNGDWPLFKKSCPSFGLQLHIV